MRDAIGTIEYWNEWVVFEAETIAKFSKLREEPSANPSYEPQFVRDLAFRYMKLMLRRYSRGDSTGELAQYFEPLLRFWKESMQLGQSVWTPEQQRKRHTWAINFEHYNDSFWLVALALCLEVSDDQWVHLLDLIDNEGEDALLDRIIATRQPGRKIGPSLLYPKPYARLLEAIDAPAHKQAKLLQRFVEHWYVEIENAPRSGKQAQGYPIRRPYWYGYHTPMKGGYFGFWCLEAVAAAKAFGLDDSLCVGHPHYPGDLLRGNVVTPANASRLPAQLVKSLNAPEPMPVGTPEQISNWEAFKRVIVNKLRPY
ncbi:PoNi-like cognate immunity protein [Polaromonas sp.]|uniref:PoNi-like cognate immunity protein n=1 Tax=Polaromonas sp. TaxID=1869339 RepID=UPI0025D7F4D5|nr:PoNi-like cognate immunity protein [Polaromonas sp.]